MDDREIAELLHRLESAASQQAWEEFLEAYSGVMLQVVRLFERDPDHVSDCFLYVCEELSRGSFRRLRRYKSGGPASFSTWLRAVVRHLCLDWHRREFGRERVFRSVERLSALEQEVFTCRYRHGLSAEEILRNLQSRFPRLDRRAVDGALERIERVLTPRQRWLLAVESSATVSLSDGPLADDLVLTQVADPSPSAESVAALSEQRGRLARALRKLPAPERVLLRLRFAEDLTLEQVGRITGLGDAQTVDRHIRKILSRLQEEMKAM